MGSAVVQVENWHETQRSDSGPSVGSLGLSGLPRSCFPKFCSHFARCTQSQGGLDGRSPVGSPPVGESTLQNPGRCSPTASLSALAYLLQQMDLKTGFRFMDGVQKVQKRLVQRRHRSSDDPFIGCPPATLVPSVERGPGQPPQNGRLFRAQACQDGLKDAGSQGLVVDATAPTNQAQARIGALNRGWAGRGTRHGRRPSHRWRCSSGSPQQASAGPAGPCRDPRRTHRCSGAGSERRSAWWCRSSCGRAPD